MIKISPSMLSCDFSRMAEEAAAVQNAGADMLHLDVMDGHFVPNLTFGAPVIKCLRKHSDMIFDTHLMISRPDLYIEDFAKAGSDYITFHIESECDIRSTLEKIKSFGVSAGLSVKPLTPVTEIYPYLDVLDLVLIMTVEPGFGNQKFIADMLTKVKELKAHADSLGKENLIIELDGGINEETAPLAIEAGANALVAGSAIFLKEDYASAITALRK